MPSQIELIAANLTPQQRRRRPKRGRFPLSIERRFIADNRDLVRAQFELLEQLLLPRLAEIGRLAGVRQDVAPWQPVTADQVRDDISNALVDLGVAHVDQSPWRALLRSVLNDTRQRFQSAFGTAAQSAEDAAREMSLFSRRELSRQLQDIVSVDIFADDPELLDALEEFAERNVARIQTTSAANFETIENIVTQGFRAGQRADTVGAQIVQALGVSESRAAFWARDQISTLAGQLTKRRQEAIGIDEYIWRTSRDELVRETHRQLEGTTQRWDDPPTVGARQVHPGEDYNCRCTAEPKLPGVENRETSAEDVPRNPDLVRRRRNRDRRRRERARRRSLSQPSGLNL